MKATKIGPEPSSYLNEDGTVTYWSVYQQRYVTQFPEGITAEDMATMTEAERRAIESHKGDPKYDPYFDATI